MKPAPPVTRAFMRPGTLVPDRGLGLLWTAARMQPLRREQAVEELDRHRALPDGGGHSLDRTVPDVAGREHPRHARLEEKRTAVERPGAGVGKVGPREDEAVLVAIDLLRQPVGVRADSDHEEEAAGANRLLVSGGAIAEHQVLQPSVASAADDLGLKTDLQFRRCLDLTHQVVRHSGVERLERATSVTRRAKRARCRAACPAEFAPPRTYTSWSAIAGASDAEAP